MANFRLDSKSIRKQIKNIIEEQYKENIEKDFGMIILKELIQNANDAYASSLFFGYHNGLKSSKNPLFQNAGLYFINDGEFKKSDLISINKMWDNAKGNNPNQIGKFGLGLKSIFHWCEAFCYLSSGISDSFKNEDAKRNYNEKFEIFNPWEPTFDEIELNENPENDIKPYPDWSINSEDDYNQIVNELNPILCNLDNWFCVWIPLRSKKLEKKPAFKNFYPGDDKDFKKVFEDNHLRYEISSILPFMSKLQQISYWKTASKMKKVFAVLNNISFPMIEENRFQTLTPYQTDVFQDNTVLSENFISYNFENNIEANRLIDNQDFPRNEEGNSEKAFNQAAISISIINESNKEGKIILDWNVFLPLSEKRFESTCKGYTILMKLHGWFFIDSGRNTIDFGKDEYELTIKQQWNRLIAEQNTIPQLIPAIKKLLEVKNDSRIIEFIIQHIRDSEIYETIWMKDALCSDYSVIYRFRPSKTEWCVINSNEPYYSISKNFINYSKSFISFNRIIENNIFLIDSTQFLSARNQDNWSKEFFISFFDIDFNELMINQNFRNFWINEIRKKIKYLDDDFQVNIKTLLLESVKTYLTNTEWKKIEEHSSEINEILEIINDKIISLSIETKKVFNSLNSLNINLILLPLKYYKFNNQILNNDAMSILNCICDKQIGNKHKIAQEILLKSDYNEIKENITDLPIFEISDHNSNQIAASIRDIETKIVVDANSPAEFIKNYIEAFINIKVFKFVFFNEFRNYFPTIERISLDFISDRIENFNHKYNDFIYRKALINSFLKDYKIEYRNIIRQLFLGENQDLSQNLYIFRKDSFWYKISKEILKRNNFEYTIFVDNKTRLSEKNIQIELKVFISNNIPKDLFIMNLDDIDLSFLDEKQLESVYKKAEENSDLLSLPIYKTINGEIISISDKIDDVFILSKDTEPDNIPKENIFLLPYNKYLALTEDIKQINNKSLLTIYLKSKKPENFTLNILDQLDKLTNNDLDEELRELLTTIAWIPSKNKENYSISNILFHRYSKDFNEIINEYFESTGEKCDFISSTSLKEKFMKHNGFQKINEFDLWIDENLIFKRIGDLLERTPKLNIGKLDNLINIDVFKIAFVEVKEVRINEYLKKWQSNVKPSILEENIVSSITSKTPPLQTQVKICEGLLKSAWQTEDFNNKIKVLGLHQRFIESYLKNNGNLELLNNIKLLNMNNKWCNANTLCLQDNIIPNTHKLHSNYNSILKEIQFIEQPDPKEDFSDEDEVEYTKEDILQLFKDIANSNDVQRNLVGIFLSFLGDGNRYWKEWTQNFFLEIGLNVENIRNKIKQSWESQWSYKYNRKFEEHFNRLEVNFEMYEFPTYCIVHTITGEDIYVESECVLIAPENKENYPTYKFGIYKLDVNNVENLKEVLKQALDHIVLKIHNFKPKDSGIEERLWKDYSKSSQLSISITQQILIQEMISIFRRLGLGRENKEIKRILSIKQSLEHKKAIDLERGDLIHNYAEEEKEIRKSIKEVIKLDDIQKQLLIGIKNELKDFQYTKDSVIFELFQNADDAYLEKETLDLRTSEFAFKIFIENNCLYIIHYGRNINQHKGNRFNEEEHWGFSNDLQKMLTLNYSDKELNNVTGKFGLGFKSVFLICDNPKILSGDLSFEILGGVYPSYINDKSSKNQLEEKLDDPFNSTLIYLPVNQEINLSKLLFDFTFQAPFLPIFSKKIKKILIGLKEYIWKPTKITNNLFYSKYNQSGLLVFTGDNWKLVFGFSEQGFFGLENIKKVWVTVPTDTETKYNFVINSDFNIDVGRRQLASEGNQKIHSEIASQYYRILFNLIDINEIPLKIEKYKFWESLFIQLTNSDSSDILWSLFWKSDEKNYLHLLNHNSILPNGLVEEFNKLVSLLKIEFVLSDKLNKVDYLPILADCGFPIEKCISQNTEKRLKLQIDFDIELINISNFKSRLNENLSIEQQTKIDEIDDQLKSKEISGNEEEEKKFKKILSDAREQERLELDQEESKFENQIKYSYSWFKCIVDADCKKEDDSKNHSERVRFSSCKISGNKLTFVNPSRYLLQSYDTAETIKIVYFSIKDNIEKPLPIKVEGVTFIETRAEVLLEKSLSNKLKTELSNSHYFWLEFKNYIDVSKKIRDAFYELRLDNEYSFKDNLPENINFVFGPPGTGKTFNIANKIIKCQHNKKVLVLTPTNKAADEIYLKIKENTDNIQWISRFGNCGNEEIINDKLVYNSGSKLQENITTTIATSIRYSYDGYRETYKFADTKWDYIIFDEASMIPIQYISFIIQKSYNINPYCSFIIAGDPKQIPPIYNFTKPEDEEEKKEIENIEKLIEEENIYSMVELKGFDPDHQNTKPYNYLIENLDTQFRSISPIGKIFSNYAYNGLLKHNKNNEPDIPFRLNGINFKEINIINFPLAGGEIFRSRTVESSHTHPYIAILISEFLHKIDSDSNIIEIVKKLQLMKNPNRNDKIEIGIISPYKSQVKLISKLLGKLNFNNLDIQIDTVHGFQGGQKDIIFCIFNPKVKYQIGVNPKVTGDSNKGKNFLNRQYIVNVAISRAKDYLFLLLPSNNYLSQNESKTISGFEKLYELQKLKVLAKNQFDYFTEKESSEIEKWCFKRKDYIYQKSNVIPHDLVNVYKESPKKYLVSHNKKSIDIQIKVDDE